MLTAIRNFVIVFAISAVIFGVIGYAITGFIVDNVLGIANSPGDTGINTDTGTSDDSKRQRHPIQMKYQIMKTLKEDHLIYC